MAKRKQKVFEGKKKEKEEERPLLKTEVFDGKEKEEKHWFNFYFLIQYYRIFHGCLKLRSFEGKKKGRKEERKAKRKQKNKYSIHTS